MNTGPNPPAFREATRVERIFNRAFGFFVGLGLGLPHNYLLQVRGRKTGRIYSTPINLLVVGLSWSGGERYLVAPRGRTQWVRNVEAAGEITLKKGKTRQNFHVRPIPDEEKPEFLKLYLERFAPTVQRYFPIPAGSPVEAFHDLARNYPVFELLPS
ncbi:MAG TPA: nitroreductase family deazaflavin-dependent oxidoreductase [Candidatus Acidoferrum sp.]|nr:nitroreductase family deazaflavin-dependent oxidoreductase [Candidatus Acidoferrum sp.]